jgi:PAS domain S-box-containing protein
MKTAGHQSIWVRHATDALACVAVGAGYFALAWLSTHLTPRTGDIAYLWPAGGFILGMLLVAPKRLWVPFALAALVADVAHARTVSESLATGLAYPVIYSSALLLTSAALRRWAGAPLRFSNMRKLALFLLIAPIAGNLLGATLGAGISYWSGAPFGESLRAWWVSDALSMLLITPFVVAWSDFRLTELRRLTPRAFAEGSVCAAGLVLVSHWAFGVEPGPGGAVAPLTHFLIPFLVWAALRWGVRGQSTAVMIVCVISVWDTMQGLGPFSAAFVTAERSVLYLQIFLMVAAAMTLVGAVIMRERRSALRAAEEWRLRYEMAVISSGNLVYDAHFPRKQLLWGGDTQKVLGCSAAELADPAAFLARVHPGDRERIIEQVRGIGPGDERAYSLEYRVRSASGTYIEVEDTGLVIGLRQPGTIRIIGMLKDVTERKRARAERERLDGQLRDAQKLEALGTMAGGIAHDFNNILGAILGHGELALADARHSGRIAKRLQAIIDAGKRGKALVEQILTFARRGVRKRVAVPLWPVVQEVHDLLSGAVPATIRIALEHDDPTLAVLGDATRLHQLLMNLATNAVQAMPAGGTLTLRLESETIDQPRRLDHGQLQPGEYAVLTVLDTGEGITPQVQTRMFEPFFTTKEHGKGTGLGLALVRAIVADHAGAVRVRSTPGAGTQVDVYLPLLGSIAAESLLAGSDSPRGDGRIVMVVDDDRSVLEMTEEMLAHLGYEPAGYEASTDALKALRAHPDRFDLVLTDESMPELTGTQLAEQIRELRPDLPVIVVSGYGGPDLHRRALAAGARAVLHKPYDSSTLALALAEALEARAAT